MGDSQFEVVDGPSSAFEVVDGPATPKKKYPLEVDKALATIPRPVIPKELQPGPPASHLVQTSPYMPGAPAQFEEMGSQEPTAASQATSEASHAGVGIGVGAPGYPKIISGVKKAIPTATQPYPSAKEAMQGATELVSGVGEAATPFMAGGIVTSPLRTAIGIGTGYAASKGAKAATKALGGGEDAQKLAETLGFWAPTLFGTLTGAHGEVSPEGDSAVLSGLGDRVGAGVKVGPGGVTVAGKLGPLSGSKTFGRGTSSPGIEPPTIEGQIIPPDPSGTLIAEHDIVMQRAGRVVQGQPPLTPEETPPPPPPISAHPDAPPSVKQGSLSADDVSEVAQMIATLPPEIRTQAMQEAHGTLTKVLMEQGASGKPVVLPSGQMAMIRDQATAEKAALQVMNDAVKDHDKTQADAAKAAEPAKEPAKAVARLSSRQKAAELAAPKFEIVEGKGAARDTRQGTRSDSASQSIAGAVSSEASSATSGRGEGTSDRLGSPSPKFEVVEPSGRALESGVDSGDGTPHARAVASARDSVLQSNSDADRGGPAVQSNANDKPTSTAAAETPFQKGDPVTFSRNLQVRKGEGKSEIIPVGTKAFIEHANAGMNFARVRLADGKVHSVPLRNLEKGSDEARGERAQAGGDISAHEVHPVRGDGAPAEGGATPPAERAGGVAGRSDQLGSSAPVAGTGEITPRVASDLAAWQPPPELGAFSAPDHGATARADTERRMGGALTRSSAEVAPGKVGEMKVSDLKVAPHKFQYKAGTDAAGTSTLLKDTKVFNPDLAGTISVWRDPADGKTYVINGHHRYELAKRTGQKAVAVRHVIAKDAAEARAVGARQNIGEGRGTPVDAAKFFRDTNVTPEDLEKHGISLGEATASKGLALSKLDESLFNKVVQGDLREGRAVAIGDATSDPAEQKAILSLVERKERGGAKVSDDTLSELIRLVKGSEQTTETTQNLFGTQEITRSLALEKAEISAHIKQQLAKDKKLFGFVSKGDRATELERGGNKIDVDKSKEISTGAAQAEEVYNKLSERGGPISSILDESARRLADGDNAGTVKSEAYQRVRAEVSKTLGGSEGKLSERLEAGAGRSEVAEAGTRQQESSIDHLFPSRELFRDPKTGDLMTRIGMNKERGIRMTITGLYKDRGPAKMATEMIQNAVDEVMASRPKGERIVRYDQGTDSSMSEAAGLPKATRLPFIEIGDNGRGMTPEQLGTVFTDVYESGKTGTDAAAGGWGVAKTSFQLGGKYFRAISRVQIGNEIKTYVIEGTPEELLSGVPIKEQSQEKPKPSWAKVFSKPATDKPVETGLTVRVWLPPEANTLDAELYFGRAGETNREVSFRKRSPYAPTEEPQQIFQHDPIDLGNISIPGAKINLFHSAVVIKWPTSYLEVRVLNKGLYQFSWSMPLGEEVSNLPAFVAADIDSTVRPGDPDYPFTQSREDLPKHVETAVSKFVSERLADKLKQERLASLRKEWKSIKTIQAGDKDISVYDEQNQFDPDGKILGEPYWNNYLSVVRDAQDWFLDKFAGTRKVEKVGVFFPLHDIEGWQKSVVFGINIPNPDGDSEGIFLNPLGSGARNILFPDRPTFSTAQQHARHQWNTIVHEFAHNQVRQHGVSFEGVMAEINALIPSDVEHKFVGQLAEAIAGGKVDVNSKPSAEYDRALQRYIETRRQASGGVGTLRGTGVDAGQSAQRANIGGKLSGVHQGVRSGLTETGVESALRRRNQVDNEPTLPGMEHVPSERAEANAEQQGKDLTEKLAEPPKSIESKAGEIEQKSPLFRDTEANPQKGLFADESGSLEPGKAATAVANAAGRVGEFLRQEIADNRRAHDLQWDMYDLDKRHEARVLRAKDLLQGLQKDGVTQDDRRAIDEHLDALEADSEHVPVPSLTPKQDEVLDKVLMPMKAEAEAAFQKVTHAGMTIPNYNPRQTKGRGGMLDRYLTPKAEQRTGKGNLLSQTMPAENRRTMMALEREGTKTTSDMFGTHTEREATPQSGRIFGELPTRVVVSLKGGQVTAWDHGTPENLGPIMNTEEGREFLDKDNNIWKLKQATKDEIEKHTNVEYYHDAAASTVVNWLQAKKAEAAHDLVETWKKDPDFHLVAKKTEDGNPPTGWRTTNLPQMKGYYFEPHTAEVLDWFNDRLKSGSPGAFDSINGYMRAKILLNPIKHPLNVGAQWAVDKGATGFLPHRWMKIGRTGTRAISAVVNQNDDFKEALDAGGALQSARGATRDLVKTFYEQMAEGAEKGEPWATKLAKAAGMAPVTLVKALHDFSSKIAWPVSDMMFLQAAYEYQGDHPGSELHDALREVGRTIPEYRLPTRIMDSPTLAKVMSSNVGTVFGSYHYGLLRSFSENAKSALGGGQPAPGRTKAEEVGKGWDRLALMALGAFGIYAAADQLAKKLTGNKDAEVQRHGIFGLLKAAVDVAHKEATPTQAITKVVTPNPATQGAVQLVFNRDLRTGRKLYDPAADWHTQGSQLMQYLKEETVPQGEQLEHAAHSDEGWKKFAWGQADVNFPKHGPEKLAQQIASSKMDTSAWTSDERERYYARQSALDGLRRGDSKAFEEGLTKGKIRPDEISSLLHRSAGSALYDKVHNFSYEETLKVYNEAIKTEDRMAQTELLPLLLEKMQREIEKGRAVDPAELSMSQ